MIVALTQALSYLAADKAGHSVTFFIFYSRLCCKPRLLYCHMAIYRIFKSGDKHRQGGRVFSILGYGHGSCYPEGRRVRPHNNDNLSRLYLRPIVKASILSPTRVLWVFKIFKSQVKIFDCLVLAASWPQNLSQNLTLQILLSKLALQEGGSFIYNYDMTDPWSHIIKIVEIADTKATPVTRLSDGAHAGIPEVRILRHYFNPKIMQRCADQDSWDRQLSGFPKNIVTHPKDCLS